MEGQPKKHPDIFLSWEFPYPSPSLLARLRQSLIQQPEKPSLGGVVTIRAITPNIEILNSRIKVGAAPLYEGFNVVRNASVEIIHLPLMIDKHLIHF